MTVSVCEDYFDFRPLPNHSNLWEKVESNPPIVLPPALRGVQELSISQQLKKVCWLLTRLQSYNMEKQTIFSGLPGVCSSESLQRILNVGWYWISCKRLKGNVWSFYDVWLVLWFFCCLQESQGAKVTYRGLIIGMENSSSMSDLITTLKPVIKLFLWVI